MYLTASLFPGNESADAVLRSTLALHKNIAEVDSEDVVHLLEIQHPTRGSQDELMQAAAQHLIITLYKNQLMHIFVRVSMVTLSINSCTEETMSMSKYGSLFKYRNNFLVLLKKIVGSISLISIRIRKEI